MSLDTPYATAGVPTPSAPPGSGGAGTSGSAPSRADLLRVLADGEGHRLVAQPVVDVAGARTAGWEVLSRFDGPWGPDRWFAAAREEGLDEPLTLLTLARLRESHGDRPPGTFVTINVEPHLLTRRGVREALLGGDRLDGWVLELTEHVGTDDEALPDALVALREHGALVAMDDAGTGWSGLSQMLRVRPDVVKVDRSLVTGLDRDPVRRAVVHLLGELAGRMDGWVLAEGVETHGELAELVGLEVPLAQGWALGRPGPGWPVPSDLALAFLRQSGRREAAGDHVLALVRPAVTLGAGRGAPEDGAVLLDERSRPTHVVVTDPAGGRHLVPALVVAPSSPPAEVLTRAMARAAAWRHAPVVCTDPRGKVVGTVAIPALVDHVVRARGTT